MNGRPAEDNAMDHTGVRLLNSCAVHCATSVTHAEFIFFASLAAYGRFLPLPLALNPMSSCLQEEETAADYYFDSYAHFGKYTFVCNCHRDTGCYTSAEIECMQLPQRHCVLHISRT